MTWFNTLCRLENDKQTKILEIDIIDQIGKDWWTGDGIAAKEFIAAIDDYGPVDTIKVRMSTPGGNIADGIAIYNYLQRHPATVETVALSEVASIGSVIFLAGDKRTVCEGTTVMIHDPLAWAGGYVDLNTCEQLASTLRHYKQNIQQIYQNRTGLDSDTINTMMSAETFMSSSEAIKHGFATELDTTIAVNSRQPEYYDLLKEKIALRQLPNQSPRDEFTAMMDACTQAKVPELIPQLATQAKTLADTKTMIARYQGIQNACKVAELDDETMTLFNLSDRPEKLIGHLVHALNQKQEADIDPTLSSDTNKLTTNLHQTIYEQRRANYP